MGIRDDELNRLVHYAKGLGVKVIFHTKPSDNAGEWSLDGSQIDIYKRQSSSKIDVIIALIHELGHHVWFIHEKNRLPDLKFDEAITKQNLVEDNEPVSKDLRKKILDVELAGMRWWEIIYKETDMKFPMWKLQRDKKLDTWIFKFYYRNGVFPKKQLRRTKKDELTIKFKPQRDPSEI